MFKVKEAIFPRPQKIRAGSEKIKIGEKTKQLFKFEYEGEGDVFKSAVERMEKAFSEYAFSDDICGEYKISLKTNKDDKRFYADKGGHAGKGIGHEAYVIEITGEKAEIVGYDEAGAFYGAISFSQLIHADGNNVYIPECFVIDYPRFPVRGIQMECRYGSDFQTLEDWKRGVDYFAEKKINFFEMAVYGCWVRQYDGEFAENLYVPLKNHLELKTPRQIKYYSVKEGKWKYEKDVLPTMYVQDYLGELIKYAKKKNITVFPMFNSLGHNTLIPRIYPEISAINEDGKPGKVGFCTRNPKTYEVMFSIYDEIIDRYLTPNGIDRFSIMLDEIVSVRGIDKNNLDKISSPICHCEKCKKVKMPEFNLETPYKGIVRLDLLIEYMVALVKHLKEKGMKTVYIANDVFSVNYDAVNEKLFELFKKEGIEDTVCFSWWDYRDLDIIYDGANYSESHLFRNVSKPMAGYYSWMAYHDNTHNIYHILNHSAKHNWEGALAYGAFDFSHDLNYDVFAECTWNIDRVDPVTSAERYAKRTFGDVWQKAAELMKEAYPYWRSPSECANETKNQSARFSYYTACYHHVGMQYPQDYPANKFRNLDENREVLSPVMDKAIGVMREVYEYFDKNVSVWQSNIFKENAMGYIVHYDYFLSLLRAEEKYNDDGDIAAFSEEIKRQLMQIDKYIGLIEDIRMEGNKYTLIRNVSVLRQSLLDLQNYIEETLENGEKPEIDLKNFSKYLSDLSWFLR